MIQIHIHAANNQGIQILGTASIWCSEEFPSEQDPETHQLTYVTSDWEWFLNFEACNKLMITE